MTESHWRFKYSIGSRCGECCEARHGSCVVVVEMEARRPNAGPSPKRTAPYPWWCKCAEPNCLKPTVCVDCLRRGVVVDASGYRCVDVKRCRNAREYMLKKNLDAPRKPGSGTRKNKKEKAA